jgi:signal transduction histidine kinase
MQRRKGVFVQQLLGFEQERICRRLAARAEPLCWEVIANLDKLRQEMKRGEGEIGGYIQKTRENLNDLATIIREFIGEILENFFVELSPAWPEDLMKEVRRERKRVARNLHDQVLQDIALASVALEYINFCSNEANSFEEISMLQRLLNKIRRSILYGDYCQTFREKEMSLISFLQPKLETVEKLCGLKVSLNITGEEKELPSGVKTRALRIVEEAIMNAIRHGEPARLEVEIKFHSELFEVQVRDDGRGFDVKEIMKKSESGYKMGIQEMMERARYSGGKVIISSLPEKGTEVCFRVPLKKGAS